MYVNFCEWVFLICKFMKTFISVWILVLIVFISLIVLSISSCSKEGVLIYKLSYKTLGSEEYAEKSRIRDFNGVTYFETSTLIREDLKDKFLKVNFKRYDQMLTYTFVYYCTKKQFNNK